MNNKIIEFIELSKHKNLYANILIDLLSELRRIDDEDSSSFELPMERLLKDEKYKFEYIENFIIELNELIQTFSYQPKSRLLLMLRTDYKIIAKTVDKNLEYLEKIAAEYDPDKIVSEKSNLKEYEELIEMLSLSYNNAERGYQMTMLHLFGIKYAEKLKDVSREKLCDIVNAAIGSGKESLVLEIRKGVKLSGWVTINNSKTYPKREENHRSITPQKSKITNSEITQENKRTDYYKTETKLLHNQEIKVFLKQAFGHFTNNNKIIILEGSIIEGEIRIQSDNEKHSESFNIRKKLLNIGIIANKEGKWTFVKNSYPMGVSTASKAILGRSDNGWKSWKDENGVIIDDLFRNI
ncbi:DUF4357 domain-containing protein [Mycoplasmopsis agassizii]|uniref:DUF4357 domain-containing protein n=1 Tax=Mycoplasmopsis agassizii TaxID=33922 RepID=UPI003527FBF7